MSRIKSGTLNAIGSFSYSCLSLFFMVVITRVNGLEQAGNFSLLYALSTLIYNIGIYSGRTYQVSDHSRGVTDKDYLVQRVITTAIMAITGVVICFTSTKYRVDMVLADLLIIMRCLDSISEVFYGMMQKHDHLDHVGLSMIIKSAGVMFIFTIADLVTKNVAASFAGTLAIITSEIVLYEYPDVRRYLKSSLKKESVIKIFRKGIYACLVAVFANYLTSAPKYALAEYVTAEEQAIFNIISMPATAVVLCAIFIVQPFTVDLSKHYREKDMESFSACLNLCLAAILGVGGLFMLGGYFCGIPLLNAVYGTKISSYKVDLMIVLFGAVFSGIFNILIAAFTVMEKTKSLMGITGLTTVFTYFMAKAMVSEFGFRGGSFTFALSMFAVALICMIVYYGGQIKLGDI